MAAAMNERETAMDPPKIDTTPPLRPEDVQDFNLIIDCVIGEKRQRNNVMIPFIGGPQKPREEVIIASLFESCAFKSTASCVLGGIAKENEKESDLL